MILGMIRFSRTSGVPPMVSVMLLKIGLVVLVA